MIHNGGTGRSRKSRVDKQNKKSFSLKKTNFSRGQRLSLQSVLSGGWKLSSQVRAQNRFQRLFSQVRAQNRGRRLSSQSALTIETSGYFHSSQSKQRLADIFIVHAQKRGRLLSSQSALTKEVGGYLHIPRSKQRSASILIFRAQKQTLDIIFIVRAQNRDQRLLP